MRPGRIDAIGGRVELLPDEEGGMFIARSDLGLGSYLVASPAVVVYGQGITSIELDYNGDEITLQNPDDLRHALRPDTYRPGVYAVADEVTVIFPSTDGMGRQYVHGPGKELIELVPPLPSTSDVASAVAGSQSS